MEDRVEMSNWCEKKIGPCLYKKNPPRRPFGLEVDVHHCYLFLVHHPLLVQLLPVSLAVVVTPERDGSPRTEY
jgi:hypothetical protein